MRTVCKGVIICGLIIAVLSVPVITGALSPEARNMGPQVNSEYSDFAPVVSPDGTYLFFTSDRPVDESRKTIFPTALGDQAIES